MHFEVLEVRMVTVIQAALEILGVNAASKILGALKILGDDVALKTSGSEKIAQCLFTVLVNTNSIYYFLYINKYKHANFKSVRQFTNYLLLNLSSSLS